MLIRTIDAEIDPKIMSAINYKLLAFGIWSALFEYEFNMLSFTNVKLDLPKAEYGIWAIINLN